MADNINCDHIKWLKQNPVITLTSKYELVKSEVLNSFSSLNHSEHFLLELSTSRIFQNKLMI